MPELIRTLALAASTASVVLAAPGCSRPLANDECQKLLDRYTELLVREEHPGITPEAVAHTQGEARNTARTDPRFEFSECSRRVSRRDYECAMNAPTVDAIERCLVF